MPKKLQLEDGVISLKNYLELKAKSRGKLVRDNLSISDAGTNENFSKGDDDTGKYNLKGTSQHS